MRYQYLVLHRLRVWLKPKMKHVGVALLVTKQTNYWNFISEMEHDSARETIAWGIGLENCKLTDTSTLISCTDRQLQRPIEWRRKAKEEKFLDDMNIFDRNVFFIIFLKIERITKKYGKWNQKPVKVCVRMFVCDLWLWFGQYVIFSKALQNHNINRRLVRIFGCQDIVAVAVVLFFRRLTTYNYPIHTFWLIFFNIFFSSN